MQNNEQSSLNTGFPNVEDFIEPEFSETDEPDKRDATERVFPSILSSPPITIALNNVITLASVALTFVIAVVMLNIHVALVPNEGISFAGLFYSVPIALLVYLLSGFLLKPVPKYNLLSVSLLPLLFAASMLHGDWHHYPSFAAYMEHRSLLNFIPIFVPPALMYLGLRLKMHRQMIRTGS